MKLPPLWNEPWDKAGHTAAFSVVELLCGGRICRRQRCGDGRRGGQGETAVVFPGERLTRGTVPAIDKAAITLPPCDSPQDDIKRVLRPPFHWRGFLRCLGRGCGAAAVLLSRTSQRDGGGSNTTDRGGSVPSPSCDEMAGRPWARCCGRFRRATAAVVVMDNAVVSSRPLPVEETAGGLWGPCRAQAAAEECLFRGRSHKITVGPLPRIRPWNGSIVVDREAPARSQWRRLGGGCGLANAWKPLLQMKS